MKQMIKNAKFGMKHVFARSKDSFLSIDLRRGNKGQKRIWWGDAFMRNLAGPYHVNFIGLYLDFKPGFDFVDAIQNTRAGGSPWIPIVGIAGRAP